MRRKHGRAPQLDGPLLPRRGWGRWVWLVLMGAGFLTVLRYVLTHYRAAAGLSLRGWLTLALAALMVVLLTAYRTAGAGPLLRAIAEFTAVAALAVLLAIPAGGAGGGHHSRAAADPQPAVVRGAVGAYDFIARVWRQAQRKADQLQTPTTTTTTPTTTTTTPRRKHQ